MRRGPFSRIPAWPPGRNIRLAHSPHVSALRPPSRLRLRLRRGAVGLKQKCFCSLGAARDDPGAMGSAPSAATLRGPKGRPPVGRPWQGRPPSPAPLCRNTAHRRTPGRVPSFTPSPDSRHCACGGRLASAPRRSAQASRQGTSSLVMLPAVLRSIGRGCAAFVSTLRFKARTRWGPWEAKR